ncbi:hypothetical protein [Flavobacterium sp. N2270]|uniref:hypothetical protein n=1 Tax=Flavobacterium sp. N2270 TaxID=2986831 RepID=UPI002225A89B|nr:hypothetical protein [Flavobacterium sp. N2270]
MKKIISLFILLFAFSFSVNAQETSREDVKTLAKKDLTLLSDNIKIDDQKTKELYNVFIQKHSSLTEKNDEESRIMLSRKISSKLESILGKEEFAKISNNKELLKKLTY